MAMQYSRLGLYVDRKKNKKLGIKPDKKKTDYINIVLLVVLVIVVLLFIFVK